MLFKDEIHASVRLSFVCVCVSVCIYMCVYMTSVGVYTKPSYDWLSHTFLLNIYLIDIPFLFSYIDFS